MILFISFILVVYGCILIFGIKLSTVIKELSQYKTSLEKKRSLRERIDRASKVKKDIAIIKIIKDSRAILKITGREHFLLFVIAVSLAGSVIGAFLGVLFKSPILSIVLALGFSFSPFFYIHFTASSYTKFITQELETALSIITTSYNRAGNKITSAIEENLPHLNSPVLEVFEDFTTTNKLVSTDIRAALEGLKPRINNAVFHEWIDGVKECQNNLALKSTLIPIVLKLSDERVVSLELENIIRDPLREYIMMVGIVLSIAPIMYFINTDWFEILVGTGFGKALMAVAIGLIFISFWNVLKHTRPIEYKK